VVGGGLLKIHYTDYDKSNIDYKDDFDNNFTSTENEYIT